MPINPIVDRIRFYIIGKLNSKGSVYPSVLEVRRLQQKRWNMVSRDYFCFSHTFGDRLFYKLQPTLVFCVEIPGLQLMSTIPDLPKVGNATFCYVTIVR